MKMRFGLALAGGVALAGAQPAAAQAQPTVQQQFESASDALAAGHWQDAASRFEALEPRLASNPRSLAVVRVRRGVALTALGRNHEARDLLKLGLPALSADDRSLTDDRYQALVALGNLAECHQG